jgi:SpoVK/Ycf46/Vps4 family AAA+-type ATPase
MPVTYTNYNRLHRDPALNPLIHVWTARILVGAETILRFQDRKQEARFVSFVRQFLGFPNPSRPAPSVTRLQDQICAYLKDKDPGGLLDIPSTPTLRSLLGLADLAGLDPVERQVLVVAYLFGCTNELGMLAPALNPLRRRDLVSILSAMIGTTSNEIARVLRPSSPLVRSRLVMLNPISSDWDDCLRTTSEIGDRLRLPPEDPLELLRDILGQAPPSTLNLDDFAHLNPNLELLQDYLKAAQEQGKVGVNILLYGPPGTGKTELSRALTESLGRRLFEVALEDRDGEPLSPGRRLSAYHAAQLLLAESPGTLILFDEMEACFQHQGPEANDSLRGMKAILNRNLETNPVPTFWITNHIRLLEDAFVRRFDICLELDMPPTSVRRRVLERHTGSLNVCPSMLDRLARRDTLAPAVASRAAGVARVLSDAGTSRQAGEVIALTLQHNLRALGDRRPLPLEEEKVMPFRLEALHTDCDLQMMLDGLHRHPEARLCLYGPPGTGKTAFAHHVAAALDRPLLAKRASDLLSKWVGQTEQLLAGMFNEARQDGAVLLLDEADSFFQDRRGADAQWEVTQVNEMLVQMENFRGLFIASTNLQDRLDPASLRRFDLKIQFETLQPSQATVLVKEALTCLGLKCPKNVQAKVELMPGLTPGDIALLLRQGRFRPFKDWADFRDRLVQELALRDKRNGRAMGFRVASSG